MAKKSKTNMPPDGFYSGYWKPEQDKVQENIDKYFLGTPNSAPNIDSKGDTELVDISDLMSRGASELYSKENQSWAKFYRGKDDKIYRIGNWVNNLNLDGYTEIPYAQFRKMLPKRGYIGGDNYRGKTLFRIPGLGDEVKRVASAYGIDPNLMMHRMAHEGFIDNLVKLYNTLDAADQNEDWWKGVWDNPQTGFGSFGLDDAGYNLRTGRYSVLDPNTHWENYFTNNEKGREVETVKTENLKSILDILGADLAYRSGQVKDNYSIPNGQLGTWTNASYNLGVNHKDLNNASFIQKTYSYPDYYSTFGTKVNTKDLGGLIQKYGADKLRSVLANKYDGESKETGFLKFLSDAVKYGADARDARIGAVGAQQIRELYDTNPELADNLAKNYTAANIAGIALPSVSELASAYPQYVTKGLNFFGKAFQPSTYIEAGSNAFEGVGNLVRGRGLYSGLTDPLAGTLMKAAPYYTGAATLGGAAVDSAADALFASYGARNIGKTGSISGEIANGINFFPLVGPSINAAKALPKMKFGNLRLTPDDVISLEDYGKMWANDFTYTRPQDVISRTSSASSAAKPNASRYSHTNLDSQIDNPLMDDTLLNGVSGIYSRESNITDGAAQQPLIGRLVSNPESVSTRELLDEYTNASFRRTHADELVLKEELSKRAESKIASPHRRFDTLDDFIDTYRLFRNTGHSREADSLLDLSDTLKDIIFSDHKIYSDTYKGDFSLNSAIETLTKELYDTGTINNSNSYVKALTDKITNNANSMSATSLLNNYFFINTGSGAMDNSTRALNNLKNKLGDDYPAIIDAIKNYDSQPQEIKDIINSAYTVKSDRNKVTFSNYEKLANNIYQKVIREKLKAAGIDGADTLDLDILVNPNDPNFVELTEKLRKAGIFDLPADVHHLYWFQVKNAMDELDEATYVYNSALRKFEAGEIEQSKLDRAKKSYDEARKKVGASSKMATVQTMLLQKALPRGTAISEHNTSVDSNRIMIKGARSSPEGYGYGPGQVSLLVHTDANGNPIYSSGNSSQLNNIYFNEDGNIVSAKNVSGINGSFSRDQGIDFFKRYNKFNGSEDGNREVSASSIGRYYGSSDATKEDIEFIRSVFDAARRLNEEDVKSTNAAIDIVSKSSGDVIPYAKISIGEKYDPSDWKSNSTVAYAINHLFSEPHSPWIKSTHAELMRRPTITTVKHKYGGTLLRNDSMVDTDKIASIAGRLMKSGYYYSGGKLCVRKKK